jgi:uroporphyrin-III C-methyltransferase/precorrin-2 dehydrogenase/sirohydrochlorin ferrochelatase
VWINCADDPAQCDFILPAIARRGPLTIAVSTGGTSPAVARMVRDELLGWLPADYGRLTEVVGAARRTLRERDVTPSWERWRHALEDTELLSLVARGETVEARDHLLQRLVISLPSGDRVG